MDTGVEEIGLVGAAAAAAGVADRGGLGRGVGGDMKARGSRRGEGWRLAATGRGWGDR